MRGVKGSSTPCSINTLHGPSHSFGLCLNCYKKQRRGTLNKETEQLPAELEHISIPKALETKGVSARARYMIEQFVFAPKRVAAMVNQFYLRALKNDKVMVEYMKILVPRNDTISPVQVVINAPLLTRQTGLVYDVTGVPVEEDDEKVDV